MKSPATLATEAVRRDDARTLVYRVIHRNHASEVTNRGRFVAKADAEAYCAKHSRCQVIEDYVAASVAAAIAEAARTGALVQIAQLSRNTFRMVRPDGLVTTVCIPDREDA